MTPTQALTPQALMELADDYARCAATAHVESLYGGSKSYTAECQKHENEARSKLSAALSAAPAAPAGEPVAEVGDLIIQVRERVMAAGLLNRAPLYAAPAPAEPAPEGWRLVPVEPTPEMVAAWPNHRHGSGHEAEIYRAMLAAAPASPKG